MQLAQIGVVSSVPQADKIIASIAPNSPVTGSIIANAVSATGIDANTLMSQMQVESQYGTQGAAKANNYPGNLKFAGQPGATQGSAATDGGYFAKFATVQDGVNALGAWDAAHQKNTTSTTGTSSGTTDNQYQTSGNTLATYNQMKSAAPLTLQNSINYVTSSGDIYIDGSSLSSSAAVQANAYSKANGNIPILTASQVADVQAADKALMQVNNIQSAFTPLAPASVGGAIVGAVTAPFSKFFDTANGQAQEAYNNSTIPIALSALGGITGSTRVSAVTQGLTKDAFPTLAGFNSRGDTLDGGLAKLNTIKAGLNSIITSILPNSKGASLTESNTIAAGTDGTASGFPGYHSDGTQWVKN